jgi:hypothetical protein
LSETKKALYGISGRLEIAEENDCEFEHIGIEIIQEDGENE